MAAILMRLKESPHVGGNRCDMTIGDKLLVVVIGCLIGLSFAEREEEGSPKFDYFALLWAFVTSAALGLLAGGALGKGTLKVAGGRDPEYETVTLREVPDAERWKAADRFADESFLMVFVGVGISALLLATMRRTGKSFTAEKWGTFLVSVRAGLAFLLITSSILLQR